MIFVESVSGPTIERTCEALHPIMSRTVDLVTSNPEDYTLINNTSDLRNMIERVLNYGDVVSTLYYPKRIELHYDTTHVERDGIYGVIMCVTWIDGTTTSVRKKSDDNFDLYNAFVWCLAKKIFGGTNTVKNIVNEKLGGVEVVDYITMNYIFDETSDRKG